MFLIVSTYTIQKLNYLSHNVTLPITQSEIPNTKLLATSITVLKMK